MARRAVRRGSVLALLLVILGSLGSLLALELVWWEQMRKDAEDAALHTRLQNETLSVLSQVTAWLFANRPVGPGDSRRPLELTPADSPGALDLTLPDGAYAAPPAGIDVSVRVQWCSYKMSGGLPQSSASAWPPALSGAMRGERAFKQSFTRSYAGEPAAGEGAFAAWRVIVRCSHGEAASRDLRAVTAERVLAADL